MVTRLALVLVMFFAMTSSAQAQAIDEAKSLDDLLEMVKQQRLGDAKKFQEREAAFKKAKDRQQQMLRDVRAQIKAAERKSEKLERTYDKNELLIADVQQQLERRMGSLRELFGVLQQVAGQTQGAIASSVTSAEFPNRVDFLTEFAGKLSASSSLPSMEEIERLWFLMQQEMTETGRVSKFSTTVITADGQQVQEEVVRVGSFNIVNNRGYLQYSSETGNVSELSRQPQGRFTSTAHDIIQADGGYVTFGLDPTRGQILTTYLDRPSLRERIDQGGLVGYVIIVLGIVGLFISTERLVSLTIANRKVSSQLGAEEARSDNPLGRVLKVAQNHDHADTETLELKLNEAILKEAPSLTRGILFIKIISVVAPLLGLLGTVTGMIVTFQAITLFGTGDPKLMAGGISQALVTTVLGLTVAIPVVLLHSVLSGRSRRIVHVLEEETARLVAERSDASVG